MLESMKGCFMHEITTYPERAEWLSSRERIGFIGSPDTVSLQNDIWTMELYRKKKMVVTPFSLPLIQMNHGGYAISKTQ